jgi:predicted metal-dependent RNase
MLAMSAKSHSLYFPRVNCTISIATIHGHIKENAYDVMYTGPFKYTYPFLKLVLAVGHRKNERARIGEAGFALLCTISRVRIV